MAGLSVNVIVPDLLRAIDECNYRGLNESRKFFAELLHNTTASMPGEQIAKLGEHVTLASSQIDPETVWYQLAKVSFDKHEYDRCVYYLRNCKLAKNRFLSYFAMYLRAERRVYFDTSDLNAVPDPKDDRNNQDLLLLLEKDLNEGNLDGYGYYLLGILLKKLNLRKKALEMLVRAVNMEPLIWSAWVEISAMIKNKEQLKSVTLPKHWIKSIFKAQVYLELYESDKALDLFAQLQESLFKDSLYIQEKIALAYHNKRDIDNAIKVFTKIRTSDPYRFDNLDIYSNLLYVKDMRPQLAHLAHAIVDVDKYRVETCCVVGNYYSKRGDHQKAVMYFLRALKLNNNYISAWTLMGHEYMEMKNSNAAIQCYRKAVEMYPKDYRAWYGLGQTYEILKLPMYSFYYYKKAQQLRPYDSRMWVALADTYGTMSKNEEALKCYWKAHSMGDLEGIALLRMAKLYEKLNETESAAAAYTEFCETESETPTQHANELYPAYKYLANYYLRLEKVQEAYHYAFKCLDHSETKEDGKLLIQNIENLRKQRITLILNV